MLSERTIAGVELRSLEVHADERGAFAEIFKAEWPTNVQPVQWNFMRSTAGTVRGVHVHVRHWDYALLVVGRASIGLRDLRRASPTHGVASRIDVSSDDFVAVVIPPGVAHGFYYPEPSVHLVGVDDYWATDDEFGCRWDDPELEIAWPGRAARLSPRDENAPSLQTLLDQLEPYQPFETSVFVPTAAD